MSSIEEKVREVIASVFGLDPAEIGEDASHKTVAAWDSLRHMNLILALEEEFGLQFDDQEIVDLVTFPRIVEAVRERV